MKHIIIILLFSIQNIMGQGIDSLFMDAHGVNLGYGVEYKLERYSIFDKIDKIKFGEKGIAQIKRKYSLSKDLLVTSNPEIKSDHKLLINKKKISDNITLTTICYILPYKYELTQILFLETYHERNINIENEFINYFIGDSIPKYVENSALIDTIDFVNRKIILGNVCDWKGPHNISCANKGQMSWSIFQNEEMAKKDLYIQKQLASNYWITNVKSEENVNVLFEGIPTVAIKVTVKINIPQFALGGSNTLIVYYINQKVRNKYISCVLSYYADNIYLNELPPLLSEVMTIVK